MGASIAVARFKTIAAGPAFSAVRLKKASADAAKKR
jgi:hypothetical protein